MPYAAKDFTHLVGMEGLSDTLLTNHFTLYQGYVTNTNALIEKLQAMAAAATMSGPEYAELKRRFGWEFNGMRLHELYFGNLGGNGELDMSAPPARLLATEFGSVKDWEADFRATGAMRGIGWVALVHDPVENRVFNVWVNEHDVGHLAGGRPLLIMDVFEHAYMTDYGLKRADYINAFIANIEWQAVAARLGQ